MQTKKKTIVILSAAILVFLSLSALAPASQAGQEYTLKSTKDFPNAEGSAIVSDKHIDITASGLNPDQIYTVWFVNMKPRKQEVGAGQSPFMFKTDTNGNGHYSAPLKESPHGSWQMVMIVEHPNRNPHDMKNIVSALTTDLG
jgi:hypothetical protein